MIKRCPLCSGKVKPVEKDGKWSMECTKCGCSISGFETREDAVSAWNHRPEYSYNLNPEVVSNFAEENGWVKSSKSNKYVHYKNDDYSKKLKIPYLYEKPNFEEDMEKAINVLADCLFEFPEDIMEQISEEMVCCTDCLNYKENKCLNEKKCYFGDPEDAIPLSMRPEYKEAELGNLLFGNSRGEYSVDRELIEPIFWKCFEDYFDTYMYFYGQCEEDALYLTDRGGFENEVFKVNPYYWGEEEDIANEPNFVYKPENIEISWYKYPFRDSYANINLTAEKATEIFNKCKDSMDNISVSKEKATIEAAKKILNELGLKFSVDDE